MDSNTQLEIARSSDVATLLDDSCAYLEDVEAECKYYDFQDQWVYLPTDDDRSAFWKYFIQNFQKLGLKRVTATRPDPTDPARGCYLDYQGSEIERGTLESGDFASAKSQQLARMCDMVVTYPPATLGASYAARLLERHVKFLMILPMSVYMDRRILRYLAVDEVWDGVSTPISGYMRFKVSQSISPNAVAGVDSTGTPYIKASTRWVTNLPLKVTGTAFNRPYFFTAKYTPDKYTLLVERTKKNQPILSVDKLANIPTDYLGIMAVPVSYAKFHDSSKFKILIEQTEDLECNQNIIRQLLIRNVDPFKPGMKMGNLELLEPHSQDTRGTILWTCACMCKAEDQNITIATRSQLEKGDNCHCGCKGHPSIETPYSTPESRELVVGKELRAWWVSHHEDIEGGWSKSYVSFQIWCMDHGYIDGMKISRPNPKLRYSPQNIHFEDTPQSIRVWTNNPPEWWSTTFIRYAKSPATVWLRHNVIEWSHILGISTGDLGHLLLSLSGSLNRICVLNPLWQQRMNDYAQQRLNDYAQQRMEQSLASRPRKKKREVRRKKVIENG